MLVTKLPDTPTLAAVYKANSIISSNDHEQGISPTLTCKHYRGSSSRWGLHKCHCLSTGRWSCVKEIATRNLNLSCIVSQLQWHHPDRLAWAHQIPWWTDEAGSPARPQSPEEKVTDSEEVWPGRDTPAAWRDGRLYKNINKSQIRQYNQQHS